MWPATPADPPTPSSSRRPGCFSSSAWSVTAPVRCRPSKLVSRWGFHWSGVLQLTPSVSGHHREKKGYQGQGVTKSEREDLEIFRWRRKTFSYFILITNTQFPREKLTTKPSATFLILDKYLMGFLTPRLTRQFLVSIAHYSSRTFTNLQSRYC